MVVKKLYICLCAARDMTPPGRKEPGPPIRIHHGVYKEFWEHAYIKPTPPLVTLLKLSPTKTHSTKIIVYRNRINSHYNSASH